MDYEKRADQVAGYQPPLARSVPLSRFTSRVGGGSTLMGSTEFMSMNRAQFNAQRKRAFLTAAAILIFEVVALSFCYGTSNEKMRPLYLWLGLFLLTVTVVAFVGLVLVYRGVSKKTGKGE